MPALPPQPCSTITAGEGAAPSARISHRTKERPRGVGMRTVSNGARSWPGRWFPARAGAPQAAGAGPSGSAQQGCRDSHGGYQHGTCTPAIQPSIGSKFAGRPKPRSLRSGHTSRPGAMRAARRGGRPAGRRSASAGRRIDANSQPEGMDAALQGVDDLPADGLPSGLWRARVSLCSCACRWRGNEARVGLDGDSLGGHPGSFPEW